MLAARRGDEAFVRMLLEKGADPTLRNLRREQAADIARSSGHGKLAVIIPCQ